MDGLIALALAKKYAREHGGSLPEIEGSGKSLVSIDGEWIEQEGYGYKIENSSLVLEDTIATVKEYDDQPAIYVFDDDPYENLAIGDKVKVTFDGTEYITEVRALDPELGEDYFIVFGGEFNLSEMTYDFSEFPFICERSEGSGFNTELGGSYEVKIEKIEEEIHQFDEEYINLSNVYTKSETDAAIAAAISDAIGGSY